MEHILVSADNFVNNVAEHPAAENEVLQKRINKIERDLYELYPIAATI